jgi:DNA-directed RNA polymerase specialized sigma24 family protein
MSFAEQAAVALERAQRDQDCIPLNRLIGRTIPRFATVTPSELDDIRSDVYHRLVRPLMAGQPYVEIAAQLYVIIQRATIDYLRRLRVRPATLPLEEVPPERLLLLNSDAIDPAFSEADDERLERLIKALETMRDSPKRSNQRRFIAVMAYAHNQSPFESLRQSEPSITRANAAQILSRGLLALRALCESTLTKRAS